MSTANGVRVLARVGTGNATFTVTLGNDVSNVV